MALLSRMIRGVVEDGGMAGCGVCGAPFAADRMVCAYCGSATRTLVSVEEELEALRELSQAAQKLDVQAGLGGVFARRMTGQASSSARFWRNAFVPRTMPGMQQAVVMSMSMLTVEAWRSTWDPAVKATNDAVVARLEALSTALRVMGVADATSQRQSEVLRQEIDEALGRLSSAKQMGCILYVVVLGGLLGLGGLMFLGVLLLGN